MWIDYIRVENEPARRLYEGELNTEIIAEVNFAMADFDPERPNHFYQEEFEFNNLPCIGYVNKIIEDETQGKLTLMANLQYNMFRYHVPPDANGYVEHFSPARLKKYLVDSAGLDIILGDGNYLTDSMNDPTAPNTHHPVILFAFE
jgi:hypothetical protein